MTQVMLDGGVVAAHYLQRGIERFRQNQFDHAIAAFDMVLQIKPDDAYARYNRATALLSLGDYEEGFQEYEVAWRLFHWRGFGPVKDDIDRLNRLPVWRGEHDVCVLAYHELGHGDAIMAMRFLPELLRRCEVALVIDPVLARLARPFGVEVLDTVPSNLRAFDYRLPFFGVMSALQMTAETIPAKPYIKAKVRRSGHKIGIAWSGRTQTVFSAEYFLSLLAHEGFRLYALQPGEVPDGVEPLVPGSDFADVADRIGCMDHIVSVDTAAIHLAGAMGHPSAHLVLPFVSDWRWWKTELWYPTIKTYRQHNPIDWAAPFNCLNEAIRMIPE